MVSCERRKHAEEQLGLIRSDSKQQRLCSIDQHHLLLCLCMPLSREKNRTTTSSSSCFLVHISEGLEGIERENIGWFVRKRVKSSRCVVERSKGNNLIEKEREQLVWHRTATRNSQLVPFLYINREEEIERSENERLPSSSSRWRRIEQVGVVEVSNSSNELNINNLHSFLFVCLNREKEKVVWLGV